MTDASIRPSIGTTDVEAGVQRFLIDVLRAFRGKSSSDGSNRGGGGGSSEGSIAPGSPPLCSSGRGGRGGQTGGGRKNRGRGAAAEGGNASSSSAGTKVIVDIVFARRCIAPGALYDTNFDAREFGELYRRLTTCVGPSPPAAAAPASEHRFKRYRFQDLVYDRLPNAAQDAKVSRQAASGSAEDCGGLVAQEGGGNGDPRPRAVAIQTTCVRLPISAFPCRADVDDVRYVRATNVSLAHLIGNGAELRFEASHPHVARWPVPAPPPGPRHRLSLVLDVTKLSHGGGGGGGGAVGGDAEEHASALASRAGRVARLVMEHVNVTAAVMFRGADDDDDGGG